MKLARRLVAVGTGLVVLLGAGAALSDGPLSLDLENQRTFETPEAREAARREDRSKYLLARQEYEREVGKLDDEKLREFGKAEAEYFRELDLAAEEYEREVASGADRGAAFEKYEEKLTRLSERFEEKAARIDERYLAGLRKQQAKIDE